MRLLLELLHPAHVHVFRHFVAEMESRGHQVLVTSREKDCAQQLLDQLGIPHRSLGKKGGGPVGLARELMVRSYRVARLAREFRPDYLLGIMGPTIALGGLLTRTPAVILYDTEVAPLTNSFAYPLAHRICTPQCYRGDAGPRHVRHPSYHELAYLHPNRFRPDPQIRRELGLAPGERLFLLRFVSWGASHDIGQRGLSITAKRAILQLLLQHGRVVISSEDPLPEELRDYAYTLPVSRMHHVIAAADLLVGESATMASEAAVLGTHAVFAGTARLGYVLEQERRYGLVRNLHPKQEGALFEHLRHLVRQADMTAQGEHKRERLLADKVDLTSWLVRWFEGGCPR